MYYKNPPQIWTLIFSVVSVMLPKGKKKEQTELWIIIFDLLYSLKTHYYFFYFFIFTELIFSVNVSHQMVEIEVLHDNEKEMREAFTVHLKPDKNFVAEVQVCIFIN